MVGVSANLRDFRTEHQELRTGMPAEAAERDRETGLARFLRGCPDPLCQAYDVALLDLDGVVYLGDAAVPGAPQALDKAADAGMRLAFVTNNSSRTPSAIAAQIASFGVAAAAADVVTSAQAAATLLAGRLAPGSAVLVVGGNGLRAAVRDRGFRPVTTALDQPAAVCRAPGRRSLRARSIRRYRRRRALCRTHTP